MTRASVLLVAVLCAACGDATVPHPPRLDVTITVQSTSPVISFTATNRSGAVVYLPRCGDRVSVEVERLKDGSWINAAAAVCLANLRMDPFELAPGASVQSQATVTGPGRFRLRTGATADPSGAMDWQVYSAPFDKL